MLPLFRSPSIAAVSLPSLCVVDGMSRDDTFSVYHCFIVLILAIFVCRTFLSFLLLSVLLAGDAERRTASDHLSLVSGAVGFVSAVPR